MRLNYPQLLCLSLIFILTSCSTNKNSFKNRSYHKMTAWFNTLFNGQEAMDNKLESIRTEYKDDYFSTLRVEPYPEFQENMDAEEVSLKEKNKTSFLKKAAKGNFGNKEEDSQRTGFAKAEEKALKAIQNHSMQIRGEEKNKLMSRAYLMLGKARYYQGKPFQALDALTYASKLPFEKHTVEIKVYTALAQLQAGNSFEGSKILTELYEDEDLRKSEKEMVARNLAWQYYNQGDLISALNGLDKAIDNSRLKDNKARYNFIQGQILSELGRIKEANDKFDEVYRLRPGFEMEARSQVAKASNFNPKVHNFREYKNDLLKVANKGTYELYKNELYYSIGQIAFKADSVQLAKEFLQKSFLEQPSDPRYRGEAYALMGEIYFDDANYVYAGAYYDSAVSMMPVSKRKDEFFEKSSSLKSLMDKYYLVQRNDSILRLVNLTDGERKSFFLDYIEELKLEDERRQTKEKEAAATVFSLKNNSTGFDNSFGDLDKGKFYFYSQSAVSSGLAEFNRVWGKVQLKDNWRYGQSGSSIDDKVLELTGQVALGNPRRYDIDFYLEQIPTQQNAINNIKIERDTTELALGIQYFDDFDNPMLATKSLKHLVETPPKSEEIKLKAYYHLYRINKEGSPALANEYKDFILKEYPNSIYAEFILNPNTDFITGNTQAALDLYDLAYQAYKNKEYTEVQEYVIQAIEMYPTEEIISKFALLNAMADGALNGVEAWKAGLNRVVIIYEGTPEADYALELLKDYNKNNPNQSSNSISPNKLNSMEEIKPNNSPTQNPSRNKVSPKQQLVPNENLNDARASQDRIQPIKRRLNPPKSAPQRLPRK